MIKDNFLSTDYLRAVQDVVPYLNYKLQYADENEPKFNFLMSMGEPWPHTDIFNELGRKAEELAKAKILRCYVNLNPAGEAHAGDFHQDDGDITGLFMPFSWNTNNGGELEFENGEKIEYVENRLVLFDAKRPHRAMPHTFEGFRYTIVFKMQKNIT